jgi:hypothetical protein
VLRNVAPYCLAVVGVLLVIAGVAGPVYAACTYATTNCQTWTCHDSFSNKNNPAPCYDPGGQFTTYKFMIVEVEPLITTIQGAGSYQMGQRLLCGSEADPVNTPYCGNVLVALVSGGPCSTLVNGGGGNLATQVGC